MPSMHDAPPQSATPAPYYSDEFVTLYHGDCREVTAWLDADVLVTDPPYGRAWKQGVTGTTANAASAGIANDLDTTVRDEALALWGPRLAVLFGDLMLPPPVGTKLVCAYRKPPDAGIRGAMGGVRRDLEALYLIGPWPSGIGGRSALFSSAASRVSGAHGLVARAGGHPHVKPQDVMEELVALHPEGVIADPFAGSGSTLVAAKALNRPSIGVEVRESYCELIAKRCSQDTLFGGAA